MIIKNQTSRKIISKDAQIASTFIDRLLGLLNPHTSRYQIFHTRFGIHTFFMTTPIDVILLDKNSRVVKIKEKMNPNRLFVYNPRFSTVIEMPNNTIKKCHIHINDKISFV